jgi:hypothetical protein
MNLIQNNLTSTVPPIWIVAAPDAGGKSRLGQLLGVFEDCIYSYSTPSPIHYFCSKSGSFLSAEKKQKLLHTIKQYPNIFSDSNNNRWLGDDKISGYNFELFTKLMVENIPTINNMCDFYSTYIRYLILCRKSSIKIKFVVIEAQGADEIGFYNQFISVNQETKIISILREPKDHIPSLKIPVISRNNSKETSFKGALCGEFNLMKSYFSDLHSHYLNAITNLSTLSENHSIRYIIFRELKNIKGDLAKKLSNFLNPSTGPLQNTSLTNHLIECSKKSFLKNEFLELHAHSGTYYRKDRQAHLPFELKKDNRRLYMHHWELNLYRIYTPIFNSIINRSHFGFFSFTKVACTAFWLIIQSAIFGFKEVRTNLNLRDQFFLRKNALTYMLSYYYFLLTYTLISLRLKSNDYKPKILIHD